MITTLLQPGERIGWAPINLTQAMFLACPVFECLLWGNRGGGKTMCMLADFAQHVGQGWGAAWRGVLFRRQFKDLENDLLPKAHEFFRVLYPSAQIVGGNTPEVRFATGEVLMFRHIKDESGYWDYHGAEIPWIGFEELTNWADLKAYLSMFSVCRSSVKDMPRKVRGTTNPYGIGHNQVKRRFIDEAPPGLIIHDEEGRDRVHLQLMMEDNPAIMEGDPEYRKTILSIKDPIRRKAWLDGSWDIVAGGMFDDLWDARVHVVKPFKIPASWRIDSSFDWGETKPFAFQIWAESDGASPTTDKASADYAPLVPRGTLFLICQWYGCNGEPNEGLRLPPAAVARGILKRIDDMGLRQRVRFGPADDAMWTAQGGDSIAAAMERAGVRFIPADKGKVSRVNGWQLFRQRLAACLPPHDRACSECFNPLQYAVETCKACGVAVPPWVMEEPGIFIFETCRDFIRTVPILPRDDTNYQDVDSEAEDHDGDAMRYRLIRTQKPATTSNIIGMF